MKTTQDRTVVYFLTCLNTKLEDLIQLDLSNQCSNPLTEHFSNMKIYKRLFLNDYQ